MSNRSMSLKARINNYAKQNHISAQVVLQNFMFENFLIRLSKSEYQNKFIIKGGVLISSIVGLDTRTTMDLDTTVRNLTFTESNIKRIVNEICDLRFDDILFQVISINPIRKGDSYGGFCVRIDAIFDNIHTPLSIDISTGDVITPAPVSYLYHCVLNEENTISLWCYNIETILAEKIETILSRGIYNTRIRDYYDIYILELMHQYENDIFLKALEATMIHRNNIIQNKNIAEILEQIKSSKELQERWKKYQKKYSYARDISFDSIMKAVIELLKDVYM